MYYSYTKNFRAAIISQDIMIARFDNILRKNLFHEIICIYFVNFDIYFTFLGGAEKSACFD